jgi:invasion protein IalB
VKVQLCASLLIALAATIADRASAQELGQNVPNPPRPHEAGRGTSIPAIAPAAASKTQARYAQAPPSASPPSPQTPAQNRPPPPTPQRTEILKFDNWMVTCFYFTEGPKKHACSAQLQVQVQQSGASQTLLSWVVSPNDSNQTVTDLQTPTGISIPPGVQIEFDKKTKRTLPFDSCDTGHCTAVSTMDANFIRELSTAQAAEILIHAGNGQTIQFNIPVKGFDKAYAQLRPAP